MPADLDEIMEVRAANYRQQRFESAGDETNDFLFFQTAKRKFAIPIRDIETVVQRPALTPVPNTPLPYIGVFSLRGNLFDAYCLARLMRLEDPEEQNFILIKINNRIAGIRVEQIDRIGSISQTEIRSLPKDERFSFLTDSLADGTLQLDTKALLSNLPT